MTDPILSLRDVRLTLAGNAGPVDILRGITLDVARGETLGLVGPSGSGKSSLLMLMGGLEKATGGQVTALGQDLTAMDEDQLARFRRGNMGVVFQSFHLIPTMTALENVAVPLELAGVRDAFARAEAELRAVGLGARIDHYPSQMSGGEQQRVALARAAAPRPAILLADEPTGNLDGANGAAIMDLLFGLRDRAWGHAGAGDPCAGTGRALRPRGAAGRRTGGGHRAEGGMSLRFDAGVAARIARRELRGGLAGFRVFLACLMLGVAAIAAVGLVRAAIERGLQDQGAVLLGGDAQMEFTYRFATPRSGPGWKRGAEPRVRDRRFPLDGRGGRGRRRPNGR